MRARRSRWCVRLAGGLLAAGALTADALATYAGHTSGTRTAPPGGLDEAIMFWSFAGLALICTLGIVLSKNVVRMATWLLGTLASVAALYFLMSANFLGAVQLIVYIGGVLVLIIFGVMLTGQLARVRLAPRGIEVAAGGAVCAVLFALLASVLFSADWQAGQTPAEAGQTVQQFGTALLTTYLVPFEAASVLLLVVMIGAAFLARPERR